MSWTRRTRLVLAAVFCSYGSVVPPAWGAVLNADSGVNISAGRNVGQTGKQITPGPGSLSVTIGAVASDAFPRDPNPGFHEYFATATGSGSASYGTLAGRAHAEAYSRPNGDFDPYGAGGQLTLNLGFLDKAEVVSNTFAPGTLVTLTFIMTIEASAIHFADGPFTPGRIGAAVRHEATIRDLESGNSTPSFRPYNLVNSVGDNITLRTFQFDTAIGHHLELDVDLMVGAGAIIEALAGIGAASQGSADVIADNTAHFYYQPSASVQLMAESGQNYALPPLPGDYNLNGVVDAADYILWRKSLGTATVLFNDDTPGIGPDDSTRWRANFGQTAGSGATAGSPSSAVPEPASALVLTFGVAMSYRNNRRRPSMEGTL
jgi:hypothetical protein